MKEGWKCPSCGAVMNPDVESCINCIGNFVPFEEIKRGLRPYMVTRYSCGLPAEKVWRRMV